MSATLRAYVPEPSPAGPRRSRRAWLVAALVAVSAVVAWCLVVRTARSTADGPRPTPPPSNVRPLPPGSPTDGLGTKMLPVVISPARELIDGQQVTAHGSGFTPHTSVGAVMCTGAARTEGIAACDLTTSIGGATTDAEGAFTMTVSVRRFPTIGGGPVDCVTGNVDPDDYAELLRREGPHPTTYDPASATCIVAVGELSDYDNSGGWPIAFEGEVFLHGTTTVVPSGHGPTVPTVAGGEAPTTEPTATGIEPPMSTSTSTPTGVSPLTGAPATTGRPPTSGRLGG